VGAEVTVLNEMADLIWSRDICKLISKPGKVNPILYTNQSSLLRREREEEVILNRLSITVTLYNNNNFYILTF
jgi:hypothetical protein